MPKNTPKDEEVVPKLGSVLNAGMRLFAQHYSITLVMVLLITLVGVVSTLLLNGTLPEGTVASEYVTVAELADALREQGTVDRYIQISLLGALVSMVLLLIALIAYVDMYKSKETMTLGEVLARFAVLFVPLVSVVFLQAIGITLGMFLFILPGVIFGMFSMYCMFVVADGSAVGVRAVFKESRQLFNANRQLPLLFFVAIAGIFLGILISLAPITLGLGQDNPVSIGIQQFIASAMSTYFVATFTVVYFVVKSKYEKAS